MTSKTKLLMNIAPSDLADAVLKAWVGLPTARETQAEAERLYGRVCIGEGCGSTCPCWKRRETLIAMIECARLQKADKRPRKTKKTKKKPLVLESASAAELADELLNVALSIPTLKEAQRRQKNVYRYARRKGWQVGKECSCNGHRRMNCPVCRRTQQLALMVAVLTMCDLELPWRTVTILPEYGRCELSKQPLGDLRKVAKRVIDTLLEHAPGITGVFVVEPCVQTDLEGVKNSHWHFHGAFCGVTKAEYKCIRQAFASSDGNGRAVQSKPVTDMAGHIAYILKSEYFGRKHYLCGNDGHGIDKYPTRTRQEAQIATALGSKRIGGRVFFINMGEVESMLG